MKDVNATVIVDLGPNEKDLFNGFKKEVRKGIRKAIKSGLTVEESEDWEGAYKVYKKACEENKIRKFSFENFKNKADRLFVCKKDGKIIGVNAIWFVNLYKQDIPRVMYSAIDRENSVFRPNDLLYWEIFKHYKGRGFDKLDLGGWQINSWENLKNVNKFKENYGEVVFFHKDYPLHIAIARKIVRNVGIFWKLNKKLKLKNEL